MNKDLNMSILMDFYGQLLTQKQFETLDMYYNSDLSLGEIAEDLNISRQGVRDFIKRGEKQLEEFEEKLALVKRFQDMSKSIDEIKSILNTLKVDKEEEEKLRKVIEIADRVSEEL